MTNVCPKCGDCLKRDTVPRGHALTVLWFCCGSRIQSDGNNFHQHPSCRERELTQQLTTVTVERDIAVRDCAFIATHCVGCEYPVPEDEAPLFIRVRSQRDGLRKYDAELSNCCRVLERWPLASGCNGHLCVSGHIGNILDALDEATRLSRQHAEDYAELDNAFIAAGIVMSDGEHHKPHVTAVEELASEVAELRKALGIEATDRVVLGGAEFGSVLIDTASGQRRRMSPVNEENVRLSAEVTELWARLAEQEQRQREAKEFNDRQVAEFQRAATPFASEPTPESLRIEADRMDDAGNAEGAALLRVAADRLESMRNALTIVRAQYRWSIKPSELTDEDRDIINARGFLHSEDLLRQFINPALSQISDS